LESGLLIPGGGFNGNVEGVCFSVIGDVVYGTEEGDVGGVWGCLLVCEGWRWFCRMAWVS